VIDNGMIVASGTPEELKSQVSGDAVILTLADAGRAPDGLRTPPWSSPGWTAPTNP